LEKVFSKFVEDYFSTEEKVAKELKFIREI